MLASVVRARLIEPDLVLGDKIASMRPRLYAVALSLRARDPDDLVQATLESALRHSSQLRDEGKLWQWLIAIQMREQFRWSRRVREVVFRQEVSQDNTKDLAVHADLRNALASLPPRMRASIVLHYMADLSVVETAQALRTTPNTVKTQLRTGLSRLKEAML